MSDSVFDPEAFLDQTIEGSNDTKIIPCPAGDFLGIVDSFKVRRWEKKDDKTVNGVSLDVMWSIEDENAKQETGRDKVLVKQSIGLDIAEDGKLDMGKGKNVRLGRLRAALDLNQPGQSFSFHMLKGRMAKVTVTQRPEGEDVFNDVTTVVPFA